MKIKLDENLPNDLVDILGRLGHDVDSVPSEGLTGQQDHIVWAATQSEGRSFVTQDLCFRASDFVRPTDPSKQGFWRGCFVVATDEKIRIRRP